MVEMASNVVGMVRAIYRYPVKSMRGESLSESSVEWQGISGDRGYAFVQSENRSTFPYLTGREVPDLLLYTPILTDPSRPINSSVMVTTPEGAMYPIGSEELHASIALRYARPFHLLRLGRRATHDAAPLSVITTSTITALGNTLGMILDPRRFRPTILIETPDGDPDPEQRWVGKTLSFGDDEMRMIVTEPDIRCKMITLDPETAIAEPRILEEVVRSRDSQAGVYGLPQRRGMLRVGQPVSLLPS
jgi:MOSC domain-containing protein